MPTLQATPSAFSGLTDADFLGYDAESKKKWAEADKIEPGQADLQRQMKEAHDLYLQGGLLMTPERQQYYDEYQRLRKLIETNDTSIKTLRQDAQILETKRESRGATLTQTGVNTQVAGAGQSAVGNENLLLQNIQQELQGKIGQNRTQADEAKKNAGALQLAAVGQAAARAGQAGYSAGTGTGLAISEAQAARYGADRLAIEGMRAGRESLLMQQGTSATDSANLLTGAIDKTSNDWQTKSTAAVGDVTGALLTNVQRVADAGAVDLNTQGVKDSRAAVDTTLGTWSFDSYLSTLDQLTSKSVNKSTWERMLLERDSPVNPYDSYSAAISPLTPIAGVSSNMLAAGAGTPDTVYTLSGTKKTGSLI